MPLFGLPGERIAYSVYPGPPAAPPIFLLHGFTADYICCGFHERDPLVTVMGKMGGLCYASRLFWVDWRVDVVRPGRPDSYPVPYLEVGTL